MHRDHRFIVSLFLQFNTQTWDRTRDHLKLVLENELWFDHTGRLEFTLSRSLYVDFEYTKSKLEICPEKEFIWCYTNYVVKKKAPKRINSFLWKFVLKKINRNIVYRVIRKIHLCSEKILITNTWCSSLPDISQQCTRLWIMQET